MAGRRPQEGRSGGLRRGRNKGSRGRHQLVRHGQLLQGDLGDDVLELRERAAAAEMAADVAVPVVEPTDDVENQRAIGDGLAKGSEAVRHGLETAVVVGDGEIALDEVLELQVEVERASLQVPQKLGFQTSRAVEVRSITVSARSVEMVPAIHDLTTQSMRTQSGKFGTGVSLRT